MKWSDRRQMDEEESTKLDGAADKDAEPHLLHCRSPLTETRSAMVTPSSESREVLQQEQTRQASDLW